MLKIKIPRYRVYGSSIQDCKKFSNTNSLAYKILSDVISPVNWPVAVFGLLFMTSSVNSKNSPFNLVVILVGSAPRCYVPQT